MDLFDHDQYARTRPRDDLWGQIRRTVNGQPVSPEQITMIVHAVIRQLDLDVSDTLLDLACGNGGLSSFLQPHCGSSLGVDQSEFMIGVAQERFASDRHKFRIRDAAEYAESEPEPSQFNKVLCYGSLSYLDDSAVVRLFGALAMRFTRVNRILVGNLPDPARAHAFYTHTAIPDLREPRSSLGVWRCAAELAQLAGPAWHLTTSVMPPNFYGAHYRFDAVFTRQT